jgi:uncharacterized protein (UPF0297 family)
VSEGVKRKTFKNFFQMGYPLSGDPMYQREKERDREREKKEREREK